LQEKNEFQSKQQPCSSEGGSSGYPIDKRSQIDDWEEVDSIKALAREYRGRE
jgi:hypothetical protein